MLTLQLLGGHKWRVISALRSGETHKNTLSFDNKGNLPRIQPKRTRMSHPRRCSEGQSGETDSQNQTPEHHLWNSQRKHDASPGSKHPQPREAAGQRYRAQRTTPRALHWQAWSRLNSLIETKTWLNRRASGLQDTSGFSRSDIHNVKPNS